MIEEIETTETKLQANKVCNRCNFSYSPTLQRCLKCAEPEFRWLTVRKVTARERE